MYDLRLTSPRRCASLRHPSPPLPIRAERSGVFVVEEERLPSRRGESSIAFYVKKRIPPLLEGDCFWNGV